MLMVQAQPDEACFNVPRWRAVPPAFVLVVHEADSFPDRKSAPESDVVRHVHPPHCAHRYRLCLET